MNKRKSRTTAILLALFFGNLGVHRYYLGYKKRGVLMTLGYVSLVLGTVIFASVGMTSFKLMGSGQIVGMILGLAFMAFGCVTAIMALVDFIKLLCNKLQPADGSPYEGKVSNVKAVEAAHISQYIIDSRAAVPAFYEYFRMKEEGLITKEDYDAKKEQLLGLEQK